MIEITSIVPYVENIICCLNGISDFTAEDHMNRVDWILDSGASLHFTGDMNDFIEYTPLEKNITANTATSADTQIIGKGTVMMAVEGSEHMVRIAPVFYVPDLSMRCSVSFLGTVGSAESRVQWQLETGQDPLYEASEHREDTSQHRRETSQCRREPLKLVGTRRNS